MTTSQSKPKPASGPPAGPNVGLRERKKARTRAAIQDAALRLYLEQGYNATTIGQIAEAADVSQATFFRYFATKEDTVMYDRLDPIFIASFLRQPAELTPIAALRAALHDVLDELSINALQLEMARWQLVSSEPKLRAAMANQFEEPVRMMVEAVAERVGHPPDDPAITTWTGALIGAIYAAFIRAIDRPENDLLKAIDEALEYFENGLPL